jgi:hypothetical protein
MGADSSLFRLGWNSLPAHFPDWPRWRGERSLEALARRLLESGAVSPAIPLGGCSFGGMVAQEIAALCGQDRVYLIGSAAHRGEINRFLQRLLPLASLAPLPLSTRLASFSPGAAPGMLHRADPDFLKAMLLALRDWNPPRRQIHFERLHGSADLIIPPPRGAHLIPGAGHLLALSHGPLCASWLAARL